MKVGKKGEAYFRGLCADANLIANSASDDDSAGWDFTVDFQLDNLGLDESPKPVVSR